MNIMDFYNAHSGIINASALVIGFNAVAAMRPLEELKGMTCREIFYDWFYRWAKGCAQQIPKTPAKPPTLAEPKP